MDKTDNPVNKNDVTAKEGPKGIHRKTLAFNKDAMLCNFSMQQGSQIPLHNHVHSQIGYVISGKLEFFTESGSFKVKNGDSYVFGSNEKHGAKVLEDCEVIEVFTPCRDEYKF